MRENSNTATDFLSFVEQVCQNGLLPQGHILVFNNAAVHLSVNIVEELDQMQERYGVFFVTLPTYSPELNPCELVFGYIKNK